MKTMHKFTILLSLLAVSAFSSQIADVIVYFWLDKLECNEYFVLFCSFWDTVKANAFHYLIAFLVYNIGFHAFVGSLCLFVEQAVMQRFQITSIFYNVFGIIASILVGMVVAHLVGNFLGLDKVFYNVYQFINA
jgi:hypothetical protein